MNYKKIYADFIADRQAKEAGLIASGVYFERHHILPRSMGGADDSENMISLTAGDHFFAHLCLAHAYPEYNQWIAVFAMTWESSSKYKRRKDRAWVLRQRKWFALTKKNRSKIVSDMNNELWACEKHRVQRVAAIREANNKNWQDPKFIEKMNESKFRRAVRCIDTGDVFRSLKEAEDHFDIRAQNISQACLGTIDQTTGLRFEYVELSDDVAIQSSPLSQEIKEKIRAAKGKRAPKKVLCIDTGETFESVGAAANKFGMSRSAIALVCLGKNKTAAGHRFKYVAKEFEVPSYENKNPSRRKFDGKRPWVLCVSTGDVFETLRAASKKLGVQCSGIGRVCRGKQKTANGLKFRYISPELSAHPPVESWDVQAVIG
jgi:hypothetical protein